MRLENKKVDEDVAEAEEQRGGKGEEGSVEPPLPPHLLIAGGGDCWGEDEKPSSKAEIIAALGEGVSTADGWSWDVEHVSWAEHEGAYYEPGFEPWAEQWAAGPGSVVSLGSHQRLPFKCLILAIITVICSGVKRKAAQPALQFHPTAAGGKKAKLDSTGNPVKNAVATLNEFKPGLAYELVETKGWYFWLEQ